MVLPSKFTTCPKKSRNRTDVAREGLDFRGDQIPLHLVGAPTDDPSIRESIADIRIDPVKGGRIRAPAVAVRVPIQ